MYQDQSRLVIRSLFLVRCSTPASTLSPWGVVYALGETALVVGKSSQPGFGPCEHCAFRELAIVAALASRHSRQKLNAFLNMLYRIDRKHAAFHSIYDVFAQHQVLHIGGWDEHALLARQSAPLTNVEK